MQYRFMEERDPSTTADDLSSSMLPVRWARVRIALSLFRCSQLVAERYTCCAVAHNSRNSDIALSGCCYGSGYGSRNGYCYCDCFSVREYSHGQLHVSVTTCYPDSFRTLLPLFVYEIL